MTTTLEEIQRARRQLPVTERAQLAHQLLRDLDQGENEDVESLWIDEAKKRYEAFKRGEMAASPAEDVFARVLNRIKR